MLLVNMKVFVFMNIFIFLCIGGLWKAEKTCVTAFTNDNECVPRWISGNSVICVCNGTYYDTITRDRPAKGWYMSYTTSESGSRFKKRSGKLKNNKAKNGEYVFELDPGTKYQTIEGFGTAATGAAGYNLKSLSSAAQENLIKSYFSEEGLEYNMLRVPIGGSDFSLNEYAYNEFPIDDYYLTNYMLTCEDLDYKVPVIKRMMEVSKTPIHIVASTWSPPKWMKYYTEDNPTCGYLKTEYFQTYADYHLKFLEQYAGKGIPIWAITTTNEPTITFSGVPVKSCIAWTDNEMGRWISENLGPTIRNSTYRDTKILALDDQRYTITNDFYKIIKDYPKVLDYIDGLAVHFYYDTSVPAQVLQHLQKTHPGLFVISTEACEGYQRYEKKKVDLGSWSRAESYIKNILQNLNNNVVGWIDWNFCLDQNGGPSWTENYVDSPIIVDSVKGEFIKQPMFYAMGHFSKFIPRGSRRIRVKATCPSKYLDDIAFLTPQNTIVFIVYNSSEKSTNISVKMGDRLTELNLEGKSITTLEFNNEECKCNPSKSITLRVKANPLRLKVTAGCIKIQIK